MLRKRNRITIILAAVPVVILLAWLIYQIPFVNDRLAWRLSELRASIQYAISPPGEIVFQPDATNVAAMVESTMDAYGPTATATAGPTSTPTITPTPTLEPTPLPESVQLTGIIHEYQKWNNCGPANLSMALSYWGWGGDQRDTAAFLKPNQRDKNVMPYEMEAFVEEETGLQAVVRMAGDLRLIKTFLANGFVVIVEKGFEGAGFSGWMGHYEVINGYDDAAQQFTAQDSYIMPNLPVSYEDMEQYWRHFNYTYIVIYPPEREQEVMAILGPDADETYNFTHAAEQASQDILTYTDRELFFAWYNRGTALMRLRDYAGAAAAYDEAFQIDARLAASDPDNRPYRIIWYQTGPYFAYFYTGRYYDVINLADTTLFAMSEPVLEESYYWRALAKEALGDIDGAIADLRMALNVHPDWSIALTELDRLGATP